MTLYTINDYGPLCRTEKVKLISDAALIIILSDVESSSQVVVVSMIKMWITCSSEVLHWNAYLIISLEVFLR